MSATIKVVEVRVIVEIMLSRLTRKLPPTGIKKSYDEWWGPSVLTSPVLSLAMHRSLFCEFLSSLKPFTIEFLLPYKMGQKKPRKKTGTVMHSVFQPRLRYKMNKHVQVLILF